MWCVRHVPRPKKMIDTFGLIPDDRIEELLKKHAAK
jgi:hypothetical protein